MTTTSEDKLAYARKMFTRACRGIPKLPTLYNDPGAYVSITHDVLARCAELSKHLEDALKRHPNDLTLTEEIALVKGTSAFAESLSCVHALGPDGLHPLLSRFLSTSDASYLAILDDELRMLTPLPPPHREIAKHKMRGRLSRMWSRLSFPYRNWREKRRMIRRGAILVKRQEFVAHAAGRAFLNFIDSHFECPRDFAR